MAYQDTILNKLRAISPDTMTMPERAVMSQLMIGMAEARHITQEEIARSERWIGCHPKHEENIRGGKKMETTLRMVRQIIRDLRIKYCIPIISNDTGYWLPTSEDEATAYLRDLEATAKSTAKAWFETYSAMNRALNITLPFFEMQKEYYQDALIPQKV